MDLSESRVLELDEVANYCPHGYGECQVECAYPGRCGRFLDVLTHALAPPRRPRPALIDSV